MLTIPDIRPVHDRHPPLSIPVTVAQPTLGSGLASPRGSTTWPLGEAVIPTADADGSLPAQRSGIPAAARSELAGSTSARPVYPPVWMSGFESADPDSRFDSSVPHPARVYGYWLGGKDHYPADREAAEQVIRCRPQVVAGARANRAFLARVVRYLAAECGIRQFLDIGTGLPAPASTHQVAQDIAPDCSVVYADNDPLVLVHAR